MRLFHLTSYRNWCSHDSRTPQRTMFHFSHKSQIAASCTVFRYQQEKLSHSLTYTHSMKVEHFTLNLHHLRQLYGPIRTFASLMDLSQSALFFLPLFQVFNFAFINICLYTAPPSIFFNTSINSLWMFFFLIMNVVMLWFHAPYLIPDTSFMQSESPQHRLLTKT